MRFVEKSRKMVAFEDLKDGECFIRRGVADCSVEPEYYDCIYVKMDYKNKAVAVNLTLNRIVDCIKGDDSVEKVNIELVEV